MFHSRHKETYLAKPIEKSSTDRGSDSVHYGLVGPDGGMVKESLFSERISVCEHTLLGEAGPSGFLSSCSCQFNSRGQKRKEVSLPLRFPFLVRELGSREERARNEPCPSDL